MTLKLDVIAALYRDKEELQKAYDEGVITAEELTPKLLVIKNLVRVELDLLPME